MRCVFFQLPVSFRGRARARVVPRVTFRGRGRPRVTFRGRTPAHPRKYNAGAGFPTPALPDKRAQRHSMQDTQPETSVPSNAI